MIHRIKELIYKGARRPSEVPHHIYWMTFGKLHCLPIKLARESQYTKIHDDLLNEDKFLLIILDACRADVFEQEFRKFFDGEMEKVYSSGRDTFEYVSNTWDGDHKDMLYVSGATPVNSNVDIRDNGKGSFPGSRPTDFYGGYTPKLHLRIDDVWDYGWDNSLGTVPPENVREVAEDNLKEDKMVAHFFQPHCPLIGDYQILGGTGKLYGKNRGNPPDTKIWAKFRMGEITESDMRKAYRSNMLRAMREAYKLIKKVKKYDNRRVVISADHGQLLGEGGLYAHPRRNHPLLREVPWLEVEGVREEEAVNENKLENPVEKDIEI